MLPSIITLSRWIVLKLRIIFDVFFCFSSHYCWILSSTAYLFYASAPLGGDIMDWWPLSVLPSVCPIPDPKSRTEGPRKLKIGRKEAHDAGDLWPHLGIKRSNACRRGGIFAPHNLCVSEERQYPMNYYCCIITSQLKALSDCSSHHL